MIITIGYLYPEFMNIYGDTGNIIALINRGKLREIEVQVKAISKGDSLKTGEIDIYFFGGGQDAQQVLVSKDIQRFKDIISDDIKNGVVALTICGGYQLFGKFYRPFEGEDLKGIGIFPIETYASNTRMINNLVVATNKSLNKQISEIYVGPSNYPNTLVGFENHSGQTQITDEQCHVLGNVIYGFGNNESKISEGCRVNNAFGTYMHGSLLPKNPHFTDFLLFEAARRRNPEIAKFSVSKDTFARAAHAQIVETYQK